MEQKEFFEKVRRKVEETLGGAYMVYHNRILKNNGIWLDGIVIRHGREAVCPTIYLNKDDYGNGKEEIKMAADDVLRQYQETLHAAMYKEVDLSPEYVLPRIIYRLVNRERNEKMLKECPMIPFLDLAVSFYLFLSEPSDKEQATVRINSAMLSAWGMNVKEVAELAEENTKKYLPPVISSLNGMLTEVTGKEIAKEDGMIDMYVLTNMQGIYGATALIYKEVVREFAQKLQSDLYLLPSSVHEFIIVPAKYHLKGESELKEIVQSVNQTQVLEEEFLSDSVYCYCRKEGKFKKL